MPKTPKPDPSPLGIYCPGCRGHRLTVVSSSRPCPGRKYRYRRCTACGFHLVTVEFIVRPRSVKPPV